LKVGGDINGEGAAVSWDAPEQEGIYNIMVKVTDNKGGEATGFVAITVRANNSPVINSLIAGVNWVPPLGICSITCDAVDLDGDDLSYEWIAERGDISGTGPVVAWTAPDRVGLSNIIVVVSDGIGGEMTRSLMISVALKAPPIIERLVVTSEDAKNFKKYQWGYKILKKKAVKLNALLQVQMMSWFTNGQTERIHILRIAIAERVHLVVRGLQSSGLPLMKEGRLPLQ